MNNSVFAYIRSTLANWRFAFRHAADKPLAIFTHFLVAWLILSFVNLFALGTLLTLFRSLASLLSLPFRVISRLRFGGR